MGDVYSLIFSSAPAVQLIFSTTTSPIAGAIVLGSWARPSDRPSAISVPSLVDRSLWVNAQVTKQKSKGVKGCQNGCQNEWWVN